MEKFSVISLASKIPTEANAYRYLEELRWDGDPVCPHCGVIGGHYFLTPENGVSRKTSSGSLSQRRTWKCADCRRQFSVLTGTVMHGSHIPLRTWIFVYFEMAANKNGIAAREVARKYGLQPKSAWHLTQRIREAMKAGSLVPMTGTVVADETYVGGNPKNKHQQGREERPVGRKAGGLLFKTGVFSVVNKDTKEVRSWIITETSSRSVGELLRQNTDLEHTVLFTDASVIYHAVGKTFASHETVDHSAREFVSPSGASTNQIENYFSQLKRSLDGTHHHVSKKHLARYLAEFDYRYGK